MSEGVEKMVLTVEEARVKLGLSRGLIYEAVRRGSIPSIRIGRRILIPREALHRLIDASGWPSQNAQGTEG